MSIILKNLILYSRVFWNHLVFWSFPTLQESYYTNLGTIYFELEKYRKAILLFEKSEESHNRQDASFSRYNWYYLGYCYLNLGDFRNAVQYFERYLKLNHDDYETTSIIGWCYELLDESELALKSYLQLLEHKPDLLEIHLECSKILSDSGRKEEALKRLERAASKIENPIENEIIESLSLRISGDLAAAVKKLKEVIPKIDTVSNNSSYFLKDDILLVLSKLQRESGDLKETLSTLEFALEKSPNDLWLINEIAIEYADQDVKLEEALKLINHALDFQPDNSIFLDTKSWILYKMGKVDEAKETVERCLTLNPRYKEAQEHYNKILNV